MVWHRTGANSLSEPILIKIPNDNVNIGSGNGLAPNRRQSIIWTDADQNPKWQYVNIGSGNGLARNRRQAITWTDVDQNIFRDYGLTRSQ